MKHILLGFGENRTKLPTLVWIQEILTQLLDFTSRLIHFQLHCLQQEHPPKIEVLSEMTNDSHSALGDINKSLCENSTEEAPTAFFSSVWKIHKEKDRKNLRPLVESLLAEPAASERYLEESKDRQATPSKPLIQEVITEPEDHLLLSPVCNESDDTNPWGEESETRVT